MHQAATRGLFKRPADDAKAVYIGDIDSSEQKQLYVIMCE